QDQSESAGPTFWRRHARTRLVAWQSSDVSDRVVAEHDGYARLGKGTVHRRELVFRKNEDLLLVRDQIQGSGTHQVALHLHFHPSADVRIEEGSVVVRMGAEEVTLHLDVRLESRLYRGS